MHANNKQLFLQLIIRTLYRRIQSYLNFPLGFHLHQLHSSDLRAVVLSKLNLSLAMYSCFCTLHSRMLEWQTVCLNTSTLHCLILQSFFLFFFRFPSSNSRIVPNASTHYRPFPLCSIIRPPTFYSPKLKKHQIASLCLYIGPMRFEFSLAIHILLFISCLLASYNFL